MPTRPSAPPMRRDAILLIEDELRSQPPLRITLELAGYRIVVSGMASGVLELIEACDPDLILLDLNLPDGDGFALCQQIRAISSVPIIIVSTSPEQSEKLRAFHLGVDDYLTKPFDPLELVARIDAILRRTRGQALPPSALFMCDGLMIDFTEHTVTLNGVDIALTPTEYRLLAYLAQHAGRTVALDGIVNHVWGSHSGGDHASIHLYISRLRRKLGDNAQQPRFILTRPGIGYQFIAETSGEP